MLYLSRSLTGRAPGLGTFSDTKSSQSSRVGVALAGGGVAATGPATASGPGSEPGVPPPAGVSAPRSAASTSLFFVAPARSMPRSSATLRRYAAVTFGSPASARRRMLASGSCCEAPPRTPGICISEAMLRTPAGATSGDGVSPRPRVARSASAVRTAPEAAPMPEARRASMLIGMSPIFGANIRPRSTAPPLPIVKSLAMLPTLGAPACFRRKFAALKGLGIRTGSGTPARSRPRLINWFAAPPALMPSAMYGATARAAGDTSGMSTFAML